MNKKGFTIVELMIVVGVLGIVAAIAIPQFATLIGRTQVNEIRHKQGLPELTSDQYEKMYVNGPDKPPVESEEPQHTIFNTSSSKGLQVTCSAKVIDDKTFIDLSSCHQ